MSCNRFFLIATLPFCFSVYAEQGVTDASILNDPTRPIFQEEKSNDNIVIDDVVYQKSSIILQSLFVSEKNKVAVINGVVVEEGDAIDGVMVVDIKKSHVSLLFKSKKVKLIMSKKIYLNKITGEVSE